MTVPFSPRDPVTQRKGDCPLLPAGPGGSVTLDQDTNRPVTILRNPRTGQIRAILRGAAAAPESVDATVSALSLDPGLERLTSRGIPDPEGWTQ